MGGPTQQKRGYKVVDFAGAKETVWGMCSSVPWPTLAYQSRA